MTSNLPSQRELMTQGVPAAFQGRALDPAFQASTVNPEDISAGISSAFSIVSIRGKVFRIKYRGEEYPVVTPGTAHPAPNIDVVLVKASQAISKIWYEQTFTEGSREAPDCFSTNGVNPDASSAKKQAQFCATCPQNLWGSKTVNGKALKACQDTKRLAVVPLGDLKNESFGGPMLLRVPPASLQDLSAYADLMVQWGQTYFSVGTQITFDIDTAHPKLVFTPMMPLTGEQARLVVELQDHPQVKRMLTEAVEYARAEEPVPGQPQPPPPPQQQAAPPPPPVQQQPQQVYTPPNIQAGVLPVGVVAADDLAIPAHLQRPQPAVVPGIAVATVAQPVAPANGHALTPEQQQIAALQAQLAQAQAAQAAPAAGKRGRKATPPPSPAPTAEATPVATAAAPQAQALTTAPSTGGFSVAAPAVVTQQSTQPQAPAGTAPTDPSARLDGLLNTILPTAKQ